jgi:hypothetical protein
MERGVLVDLVCLIIEWIVGVADKYPWPVGMMLYLFSVSVVWLAAKSYFTPSGSVIYVVYDAKGCPC